MSTMWLWTVLALVLSASGDGAWPTLREELRKHGISADALPDADRQITSYEVKAERDWFAIAYYWFTGSDLLPDELRVRTLNRTTGKWSETAIPGDVRQGGSVDGLARSAGFIYLDLHINPSAGSLLVLTPDLKVKRRLYGGSSLLLPDGRVIYGNSMIHFAPAHPGSLSMYDPRTDRDVRVYPARAEEFKWPRWIDRSIRKVEQIGRDTIRIHAREQDIVVGNDDRGRPDGPLRDRVVTCNLSGRTPRCVVRTEETGRQQN